jgi:hypothetical protein
VRATSSTTSTRQGVAPSKSGGAYGPPEPVWSDHDFLKDGTGTQAMVHSRDKSTSGCAFARRFTRRVLGTGCEGLKCELSCDVLSVGR